MYDVYVWALFFSFQPIFLLYILRRIVLKLSNEWRWTVAFIADALPFTHPISHVCSHCSCLSTKYYNYSYIQTQWRRFAVSFRSTDVFSLASIFSRVHFSRTLLLSSISAYIHISQRWRRMKAYNQFFYSTNDVWHPSLLHCTIWIRLLVYLYGELRLCWWENNRMCIACVQAVGLKEYKLEWIIVWMAVFVDVRHASNFWVPNTNCYPRVRDPVLFERMDEAKKTSIGDNLSFMYITTCSCEQCKSIRRDGFYHSRCIDLWICEETMIDRQYAQLFFIYHSWSQWKTE